MLRGKIGVDIRVRVKDRGRLKFNGSSRVGIKVRVRVRGRGSVRVTGTIA